MAEPVMKVSEISRLLILLKKKYQKDGHYTGMGYQILLKMVINDVREKLELRRRSREGINGFSKGSSNVTLEQRSKRKRSVPAK